MMQHPSLLVHKHVSPLSARPPRHSPLSRRRLAVRSAGSSGSQPHQPDYRQQAQLLERLFQSTTAAEEVVREGTGSEEQLVRIDVPGVLEDVPLWRAGWAALPGFQEVYHVQSPSEVDMLTRLLLSGPRPWRFGHLYHPRGTSSSGNLDDPDFELAPGTKAPLVGTLMEVTQAVRFPDGRLLVLAVGVGRFKVVNCRSTIPHARADLVLLPDWEEVQEQQHRALQALNAEASGGLPVSIAMRASVVAAELAAAAAAQAWWSYEVPAAAAGLDGPQLGAASADSEAEAEGLAEALARRLMEEGSQPVAALPVYGQAVADGAGLPTGSMDSDEDTGSDSLPVVFTTAALCLCCAVAASAADAAALRAAAAAVRALQGREYGGAWAAAADTALLRGACLSHASSGALRGINSAEERGVDPAMEAPRVVGSAWEQGGSRRDRELDDSSGASRSMALRLEQAVWQELDAMCFLAARVQRRGVDLAEGVAQLRPASAAQPLTPHPEALGTVLPPAPSLHPSYPSTRRAQRLSYALASVLGGISTDEGRQALLEAPSICSRLRLIVAGLRRHRAVLAAVVAVQDLE